ncbi:DUF192 domain-containing protein [Patescibacteria group bacterium]|nr:DUF192 domain-containing protein [Patescibacteria group bacterium]
MTKKILFFLFLTAVIAIWLFFYNYKKESENPTQNQVCFKNNCFSVELAKTQAQRAKGLMFQTSLPPEQGMLFVFETEGEYPFWMKNTQIALDIIWLDRDRRVVFISAITLPCKEDPCPVIKPDKLSSYVLEINAGIAEETGLKIGDQMVFKLAD